MDDEENKLPEISQDIPLEDQWFFAEQDANQAHHRHQTLYRLREHVLYSAAQEKMQNAKDLGLKMTKTAAIEEVKSSDDHEQYIRDMVDAELEAKNKRAVANYIEKAYFGAKQSEKSERKVYNYNESVSRKREL